MEKNKIKKLLPILLCLPIPGKGTIGIEVPKSITADDDAELE